MANLWFKNILGKIPTTEKLEAERAQLIEEFNKFNEIKDSQKLERYFELKELVNSEEFRQRKKELDATVYKGSEEEKLVLEFEELKKDKELKIYFRVAESDDLKRFKEINDGRLLQKFFEVKEIIESGELNRMKEQIEEEHQTELNKEKRFKELKRNSDLKKYQKYSKSQQFENYNNINGSDLLGEFEQLKENVEQFDYSQINKKNKSEFTEQLEQQKRYKTLLKNKNLKQYFKFVNAKLNIFIEEFKNREVLNEYQDLQKYVESEEYKDKLVQTIFKNTEAFKLQTEFKELKKNAEIKFYYKYKDSSSYGTYLKIEDSDKLNRYNELNDLTTSEDFQKQVEYLKDLKKYEKTDDYKALQEFKTLEQDNDIKWYFKTQEENPFKELIDWQVVFEDDFDSGMNNEVWDHMLFSSLLSINENYSTEGEKQIFTNGENVQINNSELSIITKQEKATGKLWTLKRGFIDHDFQYTSGTINSAKSFRFNEGRIETKVKVQNGNQIIHGFSLKGEKSTPHIDLIKTGKGTGFEARYIPSPTQRSVVSEKVKGVNVNDKYFIYRLDWDENELVWFINNFEIARAKHQLNGESLYINIASIVEKAPQQIPALFSVDWIRVYKKSENE